MRQKSTHSTRSVEKRVRDIRRKTRRRHSTEEKIRIVLEGLRGEESIASLCRRKGIAAARASSDGSRRPYRHPQTAPKTSSSRNSASAG